MIGETHCEHISLTLFISHIVLRLQAPTGVLCCAVQCGVQCSVQSSVQCSVQSSVQYKVKCTWTHYGCSVVNTYTPHTAHTIMNNAHCIPNNTVHIIQPTGQYIEHTLYLSSRPLIMIHDRNGKRNLIKIFPSTGKTPGRVQRSLVHYSQVHLSTAM